MIRTLKKLLFNYFTFPPNANTKWKPCYACTG